MALKKIPKPKNTRIIVNKSVDKLEIYCQPPTNPFILMIGDGIFIILLLPFCLLQQMIIPFLFVRPWLILLLILLATLLLFLIISGHYVYIRRQIKFDRNRFEIKEQILGFCSRSSGAVSDIVDISTVKGRGLKIRLARSYPYSFGKRRLSDRESAWLAQEIQDWLNLKS